ncbi:SMR domain-containing protein [Schizosaccharomyces japonicus yFS275]|uniref:SMR domain-containing protein n=1 Tax=Schizosaccharomyces japonicus (strain yFS275 / FY16936) TaxID=402676 RepID=B6JZA7_SCHJY|nr:SMR domain-containing protein [Schizosaccharomyces japonicus yFS275]EEB06875.2 SMR domain-containing protein [Schizosaccharomyces japonicus yFS275]
MTVELRNWKNEYEDHYSKYLDPSLVLAIVNDTDDRNLAKETLDVLKNESHYDTKLHENALRLETLFLDEIDEYEREFQNIELSSDTPSSQLTEERELEERYLAELSSEQNGPDVEIDGQAYVFVRSMFPQIDPIHVKFILRKTKNDTEACCEELLSFDLLKNSDIANATDAIFVSTVPRNTRSGKRKNKRSETRKREKKQLLELLESEVQDGATATTSATSPTANSSSESHWDKSNATAHLVSKTLNVPTSRVLSTFHANSSSFPRAIMTLLETHPLSKSNVGTASSDEAIALSQKTKLPVDLCSRLLQCSTSPFGAQLLAGMLAEYRSIQVRQQFANEANQKAAVAKDSTNYKASAGASETETSLQARLSPEECLQMADEYRARRNEAYRNASRAYREGKSQHLFGGAATYYSEQGREYNEKAEKWHSYALKKISDCAEPYFLDLHGVTVPDAKVIVREALAGWWAREAGHSFDTIRPYTIVTGIGKHSGDYGARLLPSVVRLLKNDKWKFEVRHGEITVYYVNKHA